MRALLTILTCLLLPLLSAAQDAVILDDAASQLNHSIADQFSIYESEEEISCTEFLANKHKFEGSQLTESVANLDFTSSCYFIHFKLVNHQNRAIPIRLEVGRPITNQVILFDIANATKYTSGDAVPFNEKTISTTGSVLPMSAAPHSEKEYLIKLTSDGEIISLPIIFWEQEAFERHDRLSQFIAGIFYGIFLFVILIYLNFYALLRDRLFLLYIIYVLFSGLLQFTLDGYVHQYLFTSGGYFTQHTVIVVAGFTVIFALQYARRYLNLEGVLKRIVQIFSAVVLATMFLSLIPGKIYETCYPLINGFSFLSVTFVFLIAVRARRRDASISRLFLIGICSLMIGAIIFILGNFSVIDLPALTQNSLKLGTLIEIICLSILMAGKYKSLQAEKEAVQQQLLIELEAKNKIAAETNIRLEQEVQERTKKIEDQRLQLAEKNEDLVASIKYAQRIQSALLSNEQKFKSLLPDSFVVFHPRDIVSGDFYWIERIEPSKTWPDGLIVYATADCTGHGVPGAFVSIICNNLLKLGKANPAVQTTGEVLNYVNEEINTTLNSAYSDTQIRDGMDISLCAINPATRMLYFSGAKNGAYIIRNKELIELKGDRFGIGFTESENQNFATQSFQLEKGDLIYTYSDGYVDQFGGPKGKKYTSRRLKELLLTISHEPLNHQEWTLENTFDIWKDEEEQVDDVLLIGVLVN